MRLRLFLLLWWLLPALALAQFTTVTATVTTLQSATYTFDFVNQASGGPPLLGGISVFPTTVTGAFDASGHLSVSLADNNQVIPIPSQWRLSVTLCKGSASGPIGFNIQQTITGTTVDLSSALTAALPSIPTGCNGGGGGSGSVQPAPQFRLFIQPNAGTQAVAGPASTVQNAVTPLLQGLGNTDMFASGGGNNGIANFFAANPTGLGAVPPTSTDTEAADTTVGSGARLFDQRSNGYILTTKDVGQSHNCAPFIFGPATDTICRRDTFTTPTGNHNHVIDYVTDYSPGYTLGSSGTSATGWSGAKEHLLQYDGFSRGIKSGLTTVMNCYSTGDCNGNFVYMNVDGGATASADQGAGAAYFQVEEATSYFHGTVATGGTGASSLTTTFTSGQNGFTDGGYLLDITKGTLSGTVSDISYPTVNGTGFMAWDLTGITMPVSTAWGTLSTATTSTANGKFQIPVSQTITITVPAGSGAFVVGNNACIVQGFAEQVAITAVGTLSGGSQSVTFTTRYGYNSGALLMQGGMCGQFGTKTGATWRTAIMAVGSLSSTQVILAACTHGSCTDSSRASASDLVVQVIGGNGTGVSFYPGAEITGTNGGTPNSVQLGTNTTVWANGDAIEGPHPPAVNTNALALVAAQTTPENDSLSSVFDIAWNGPTPLQNLADWTASASVSNMLTLFGNYTWGVQLNFPGQGAIQCNCTSGYVYQENGGNYAGLRFTDAGGFIFDGYGGTAPVLARNIPGVPTLLGQIPIATSLTNASANYQPVTVSGDGTLSSAGVLTVTKSSGNPICTSTGGPCSTGIANVQVVLPTGALAANTCSAVITTTMTGVTTTSTFTSAFASDASGVTGYGSSGGLSIIMWPTANTNNLKLCNPTASSITPGAMTINVGAR